MNTQNFGLLWRKVGVNSGVPCLTGTGISCETLAHLFAAGDSIPDIATDFDVSPAAIEAAIRLVLFAKGTNLDERRAAAKVARVLPLLL